MNGSGFTEDGGEKADAEKRCKKSKSVNKSSKSKKYYFVNMLYFI